MEGPYILTLCVEIYSSCFPLREYKVNLLKYVIMSLGLNPINILCLNCLNKSFPGIVLWAHSELASRGGEKQK